MSLSPCPETARRLIADDGFCNRVGSAISRRRGGRVPAEETRSDIAAALLGAEHRAPISFDGVDPTRGSLESYAARCVLRAVGEFEARRTQDPAHSAVPIGPSALFHDDMGRSWVTDYEGVKDPRSNANAGRVVFSERGIIDVGDDKTPMGTSVALSAEAIERMQWLVLRLDEDRAAANDRMFRLLSDAIRLLRSAIENRDLYSAVRYTGLSGTRIAAVRRCVVAALKGRP